MRKLLLSLFIFLCTASMAFGASTFVVTSDTIVGNSTSYNRYSSMQVRVIELTATDDTAAADPTFTLSTSTSGLTNPLEGWWLYKVCIDGNHAGTEMDDDSDFAITENDYDILGGQGTNQVDSDATNCFQAVVPYTEAWTGTITNNTVDGGIAYFRLIFYGEKIR